MDTTDSADRAEFLAAFLEAAAWQAHDDDGGNLDAYDWSEEAKTLSKKWCDEFMDANAHNLRTFGPRSAGFNFALSANGHGAGFHDHPGPEAHYLSQASKPYAYEVWRNEQGTLSIE